ncbi:MAG: hypothetical protein AB1489_05515 [Acidobacteriota bacterium]
MRVRRLKLLETEILEREADGYQAIVKLRFVNQNFVGVELFKEGQQAKFEAIAKATTEAIKQALPLPVDIDLRKVVELHPPFLNDVLVVVMMDLYINGKQLSLTGCCVCMQKDLTYGIARATLDSTNRVVDYLLNKYQQLNTLI